MVGIINYETFLAAVLILAITPGIDTTYILSKSITQGKKAGIYSTLGITSGVLVHTTMAALGLSLIVAQSASAFMIVKYLGAAYLLYLGIKSLTTKDSIVKIEEGSNQQQSQKQNYISGLFTNVLNPKVALTFLAFFPQFIEPSYVETPVPFILLGFTYGAVTLLWYLLLSRFASLFSNGMRDNPKINTWINKASGLVFILMAFKVAFSKR